MTPAHDHGDAASRGVWHGTREGLTGDAIAEGLARIEAKPGDLLVLRVPQHTTPDEARGFARAMDKALAGCGLHRRVAVLLLDGGAALEGLSDEKLRAGGMVRLAKLATALTAADLESAGLIWRADLQKQPAEVLARHGLIRRTDIPALDDEALMALGLVRDRAGGGSAATTGATAPAPGQGGRPEGGRT